MDLISCMNKALEYIENNLDKEIDYRVVEKISCCSQYQFRRVFSFLAGISLSEYIRRRRLSNAVYDLKNADSNIIDIAVKYGYNSADSFSRAFQNFHGVLPSYARNLDVSLKSYPKLSFQLSINGGNEMNYRIVEKTLLS